MNKDNAKEFLPLVQALAEGKVIQFNKGEEDSECWTDYANVSLTLPASRYRIKPEPRKPREWWVNIYAKTEYHVFHDKKEQADRMGDHDRKECVRVREIIEE